MSDYKPGSFGCHEALHMTSMFADMLARHLLEHSAIQANPAWAARVERAVEELGDLYQEIGAVHIGAEAKEGSSPSQLKEVGPEDEARGGREVADE